MVNMNFYIVVLIIAIVVCRGVTINSEKKKTPLFQPHDKILMLKK